MIAFYLLAAHMAGDYLFQSAWMAANKLHDVSTRCRHCLVYTLCFLPIALIYAPTGWHFGAFLAALYVCHFATDSRRWRTSNPWPAMPILQDQSLHVVQIAVLAGTLL